MGRLAARVAALLGLPATLLAQQYEAPELPVIEPAGSMMDWLFMAGFILGCLVVAFLPCKRSNLQ